MPDWSARLSELAVAAKVPGAVLGIWQDGETTIAPYGVLNASTGVETTEDAVFQLGSVTKPWTATMIVQLAAEGRLDLDDAVVKLLPEASIDPRITVCHLLTHTSGIDGDVFTDTGRGDECLERYVALLADVEQLFEPGTAYSYCNAGFVLLGRLIEVLDGGTWDESLRKRLVEPLGLTRTVTLPEEAILHRAALGHLGTDGSPVKTWQLPRSIGPAGGVTASAGDLLEFARMHLTDERYRSMQEPQVPYAGGIGGFSNLGLAWRIYDWQGRGLFGHDGTTISQVAFLRIDPEARLIMCLLTNSGNGTALFEPLATEVFRHFTGVGHPASPQPADGPVDDRHVGRYERATVQLDVVRRDEALVMEFRATGDRLSFAEQPVQEYELRPTEPADGDHFVAREAPDHPWVPVTFTPSHVFASGRVTPKR
ncbi:class A beta-lactamase-related serine hydrolase [Kribbella capetownensis]|uniref:Class A beta-lactamase-related serine hydrolase n=1 Tax=Kribbella capetownensis TaxID=1572659 RepID=A0A4R0K067_9ACTN|nr:serine hydrolase domain-containing protein [Kribbella capetownensis]TCC51038.1 class A beta-lactamase-related serine hydrolase [Kribbella capetownensis]